MISKDDAGKRFFAYFALTAENVDDIIVSLNDRAIYKFQIVNNLALDTGGESILLAYAWSGKGKKRRFFWKSGSTGVWRAGTGFDDPRKGSARFKKGQDENLGYIFETQVHGKLEVELSKILKALTTKDVLFKYPTFLTEFFFDTTVKKPPVKKDDVLDYFCNKDNSKGIWKEYTAEVAYDEAKLFKDRVELKKTSHIDPKVLLKPPIPRDPKHPIELDPKHITYTTKMGVTKFQESSGLSNFLKQDLEVWQPILNCLNRPITGDSYKFYFDLLKTDVNVDIYEILSPKGNIRIEIANTSMEKEVTYISKKDSKEVTKKTRVCWIKSVYFSKDLSSFGNYTKYPNDLSFLPQKIMDYDSQISKEVIRKNFNEKVGAPYTSLVVYNEKYNHLIRSYKQKKGFSTIYDTVYIEPVDLEVLIKIYTGNKVFIALHIYKLLMSACNKYLAYNTGGISMLFSSHGKTGKARCEAFMEELGKVDKMDLDSIDVLFKNLFVSNKVGSTVFTSNIGVSGHSLFTYVCNEIYQAITEADDYYEIHDRIKSPIMQLLFFMRTQEIGLPITNEKTLKSLLESLGKV
ncbi:MAG: hypothetical protein AB9866_15025 [Syntrophobacteraceae bacterium]